MQHKRATKTVEGIVAYIIKDKTSGSLLFYVDEEKKRVKKIVKMICFYNQNFKANIEKA